MFRGQLFWARIWAVNLRYKSGKSRMMLVLCQCIFENWNEMARLEYLDDFHGLRNEKRINMRHTLSTLTLRSISALQGLWILRKPRKQRRCPSPCRLHGDFVAGVSNLMYFFPKHKQGFLIYSPWGWREPRIRVTVLRTPGGTNLRISVACQRLSLVMGVTRGRRFWKQDV